MQLCGWIIIKRGRIRRIDASGEVWEVSTKVLDQIQKPFKLYDTPRKGIMERRRKQTVPAPARREGDKCTA